jgi:hypothetical protein
MKYVKTVVAVRYDLLSFPSAMYSENLQGLGLQGGACTGVHLTIER